VIKGNGRETLNPSESQEGKNVAEKNVLASLKLWQKKMCAKIENVLQT